MQNTTQLVCTRNALIENTNSAGGTSAENTSVETQHKESTETHVSGNKIKTIVINIEEIDAILLGC